MAVSYMPAVREFENKSKEVEEVEEVEEVMDVDECKVMDADECSSDNGADDFYDDELEIIPHNAPVVDLTEAQPDEPDSTSNAEEVDKESEKPNASGDDKIDLAEAEDEKSDKPETANEGDASKNEASAQPSEESETPKDNDVAPPRKKRARRTTKNGAKSTKTPSSENNADSVSEQSGEKESESLTNGDAAAEDSSCQRSDAEDEESSTAAADVPPLKVDLSLVKKEKDEDWIDSKEGIVDRVARSFMRKMHHAHRTKECSVVPRNHFGPIPGVEVGTCWRFRLSVSESGVHRPLVAGIHGRTNEGAYSIVVSGVYDDDLDYGDEFLYCGSGGRAKDPTKRYSAQIMHQKLENGNRALALCCNAPVNDQDGAEAEDWQGGKPVRVVRNYRLSKHSEYAPTEGNRYDGIYKVVKYFPTIGKVGLIVWKFLMRRDDPIPAPWTPEGKKLIDEKNLNHVIWPEDCGEDGSLPPPVVPSKGGHTRVVNQEVRKSARKRKSTMNAELAKRQRRSELLPDDFDPEEDTDPEDSDDDEYERRSRKRRTDDPTFQGNWSGRASAGGPAHGRKLRSANMNQNMVKFGYIKCESGGKTAVEMPEPSAEPQTNGDAPEEPEDVKPNVEELQASLSKRRGRPRKQSTVPAATEDSATESSTRSTRTRGRRSEAAGSETLNESMNGVKVKVEPFELPDDVRKLVNKDTLNKKLWKNCRKHLRKGEEEFLKQLKDAFKCPSCSELVKSPVTTPCEHNICKDCINGNFSKKTYACPDCETDLGSKFKIAENENLASALLKLFPDDGSESSRAD